MAFIHNSIKFMAIDLNTDNHEVLAFQVFTGNNSHVFVLAYRPPYSDIETNRNFLQFLSSVLRKFPSKQVVLIGDFNYAKINGHHITR